MKTLYRRRLLSLISILKIVSKPKYKPHWELSVVMYLPNERFGLSTLSEQERLLSLECRSSACAFGWYAAKTGLAIKSQWFEQACDHFGLSSEDCTYIFLPRSYRLCSNRTPRDVIAHIQSVLDSKRLKLSAPTP